MDFAPVACASSRMIAVADAAGVVSRQAWNASDAATVLQRTLVADGDSGTGAAGIAARASALNCAVYASPDPNGRAFATHESAVVAIVGSGALPAANASLRW